MSELPARPGRLNGLRHIALLVPNLEECERFYVDVLGMEVLNRANEDLVYLTCGNDNLSLGRGAGASNGLQTLDHYGFIVDSVEELEAWYFGDWPAVQAVHPKLPDGIPKSRGYRDPDAIAGGTWEAFERVLQRHGYAKAGLAKIQTARAIGGHIDPGRSRSPSFLVFYAALVEAWEVQRTEDGAGHGGKA